MTVACRGAGVPKLDLGSFLQPHCLIYGHGKYSRGEILGLTLARVALGAAHYLFRIGD